ncbi:hypothetical protein MKSMC1_26100 [Mycobacterium kansasii]|nr:hypothetical protein MKSMC1_26100 [Mycobacterium kansasii]
MNFFSSLRGHLRVRRATSTLLTRVCEARVAGRINGHRQLPN